VRCIGQLRPAIATRGGALHHVVDCPHVRLDLAAFGSGEFLPALPIVRADTDASDIL